MSSPELETETSTWRGCFPSHGNTFGGSLGVSLRQHLTALLAAGRRAREWYLATRDILVTAEAPLSPMSPSELPSSTSSPFPRGSASLRSIWELLPFPHPTSKCPVSPPPSSHLPLSPLPRFTVTR